MTVGEIGERGQKVQISSHQINELWENNVKIFLIHVWSNYWVSGTELEKRILK